VWYGHRDRRESPKREESVRVPVSTASWWVERSSQPCRSDKPVAASNEVNLAKRYMYI